MHIRNIASGLNYGLRTRLKVGWLLIWNFQRFPIDRHLYPMLSPNDG